MSKQITIILKNKETIGSQNNPEYISASDQNLVRDRSTEGNNEKKDESTVITPTFLLKGIDPNDLLKRYLNGEFFEKSFPPTKIHFASSPLTSDVVVGPDNNSKIYEYVDKNNEKKRIYTTNHDNYFIVKEYIQKYDKYPQSLSSSQHQSSSSTTTSTTTSSLSNPSLPHQSSLQTLQKPHPPTEKKCFQCKRLFNHEPIGIPVYMKYFPELNFFIFHVVGTYCGFECVFLIIKFNNGTLIHIYTCFIFSGR